MADLRAALVAIQELHKPVGEEVISWECAEGECECDDPDNCQSFTVQLCEECLRVARDLDKYYGEEGVEEVMHPCATRRLADDALGGDNNG